MTNGTIMGFTNHLYISVHGEERGVVGYITNLTNVSISASSHTYIYIYNRV